jgi:APA family basic amino acid/polyamine antiporter
VIVLRKKQPERPRSFRVPSVPLFPIVSIMCCVVLMMGLPLVTWIRFFVWLFIGFAIYFPFSQKRNALAG